MHTSFTSPSIALTGTDDELKHPNEARRSPASTAADGSTTLAPTASLLANPISMVNRSGSSRSWAWRHLHAFCLPADAS
jgi:hypothetical protein